MQSYLIKTKTMTVKLPHKVGQVVEKLMSPKQKLLIALLNFVLVLERITLLTEREKGCYKQCPKKWKWGSGEEDTHVDCMVQDFISSLHASGGHRKSLDIKVREHTFLLMEPIKGHE